MPRNGDRRDIGVTRRCCAAERRTASPAAKPTARTDAWDASTPTTTRSARGSAGERAERDGEDATDEAGLAARYGVKVTVVPGDTINFTGSATPGSSLTWRINLRHCSRLSTNCHTHVIESLTGPGGSFVTVVDLLVQRQLVSAQHRGHASGPRPRLFRRTLVLMLLDAALAYARHGIPVLPVHSPAADGSCSCERPGCANTWTWPAAVDGSDRCA
mgnify:CR=1 FL=1